MVIKKISDFNKKEKVEKKAKDYGLEFRLPFYLENVFNNDEYTYLNKIKLAEYIAVIKSLKEKKDTETLNKKLETAKFIVKKYENQTHKGLMSLLKSLI